MANILVIDDDPDVCLVLKYALEEEGHTVTIAHNTHNLSTMLSPSPNIVLLDVLLPDTHGLECLPKIQALSPSSRIVIITGVNDYRMADLFYEAGVDGFLAKPIHIATLSATVNRVLNLVPLPSK